MEKNLARVGPYKPGMALERLYDPIIHFLRPHLPADSFMPRVVAHHLTMFLITHYDYDGDNDGHE